MVLFSINARFNASTGNKTKVKITGGINLQKLSLIGYAVSLNGVGRQTQEGTGAGEARNAAVLAGTFTTGFQGHRIPNVLLVNLDVVGGSSNVHNATSQTETAAGVPVENTNPYSSSIHLPMSDTLHTIQMGMDGIKFDIGKTIHNEIEIEVSKYDGQGNIVAMDTGTPALVDSDGDATAATANKAFGSTTLQNITLYFNYDFSSYF